MAGRLVDVKWIAAKYRVAPSTVRSWKARYADFPKAKKRDPRRHFIKLYWSASVADWFKKHTRGAN